MRYNNNNSKNKFKHNNDNNHIAFLAFHLFTAGLSIVSLRFWIQKCQIRPVGHWEPNSYSWAMPGGSNVHGLSFHLEE